MNKPNPRQRHLVVPPSLERSRSHPGLLEAGRVDKTARQLLAVLTQILGVRDLGEQDVLDVGCGVKLTRAIINHDLPIGHYTGLDVDPEVIRFLGQAVDDARFTFQRIDVHNERYNASGTRLDASSSLGLGAAEFDVITGYSLFTHLDPHDLFHMARLMRAGATPRTRLVVTAFLDLHSEGGHGFIDRFSQGFGASMLGISKGGYLDVYPDDPLRVTLYDERYARELFADAGWRIAEILDPSPAAQHTIVASPA